MSLAFLTPPMPCSPNDARALLAFELDAAAEVEIDHGEAAGSLTRTTTRATASAAPYAFQVWVPDGREAVYDEGTLVYYRIRARTPGAVNWETLLSSSFRLARAIYDETPYAFTFGGDSGAASGEATTSAFKTSFLPAVGVTRTLFRWSDEEGALVYTDVEDAFHVAAGDILGGYATAAGYWRAARSATEGWGIGDLGARYPVRVGLGNREADTSAGAAASRELRWPIGGAADLLDQQEDATDAAWLERYYWWQHGPAMFVMLDDRSQGIVGGYRMSPAQRAWLAELLEAQRPLNRWCFVFAHSALYDPDPVNSDCLANLSDNRAWLLDLLHRHRATAYLHGHYHGWSVYTDPSGLVHACATFGAALDAGGTSASGITWRGQSRYALVTVGWNADAMAAHPGRCMLEIVNPANQAVADRVSIAAIPAAADADVPLPPAALLSRAGDSAQNPLASGAKVRVRISKDPSASPRQAWVSSGGPGGGVFAELTARCSADEDSAWVDVVVGTDLEAADPPKLNVIHMTLDDDTHESISVWCLATVQPRVLLDGYDASDPAQPLVVPVYVES